jgi:hypothetical protein
MKISSQNFIDIYSFSHISHGIIFYLFFHNILKFKIIDGIFLAIIIEIIWEIIENSDYIIKKYRQTYKDYYGDSLINILGDIIFMIIGYILSYLNSNFGILVLILIEIVLYKYNANLYQLSIGTLLNKL